MTNPLRTPARSGGARRFSEVTAAEDGKLAGFAEPSTGGTVSHGFRVRDAHRGAGRSEIGVRAEQSLINGGGNGSTLRDRLEVVARWRRSWKWMPLIAAFTSVRAQTGEKLGQAGEVIGEGPTGLGWSLAWLPDGQSRDRRVEHNLHACRGVVEAAALLRETPRAARP